MAVKMTFIDDKWEPIEFGSSQPVEPQVVGSDSRVFSYSKVVHALAVCSIGALVAFGVFVIVFVLTEATVAKALSAISLIVFSVLFVFWLERAKSERQQIQIGQTD